MGSWVLHDQTLITSNAWQDGRLFNRPLANVCPIFIALGVLLLGVRGLPSRIPVFGKLFEEGSFEVGGLDRVSVITKIDVRCLTVKVGLSATLETIGVSASSCASEEPAKSADAHNAAATTRMMTAGNNRKRWE